jgi:hypothetical protein
MVLCNKIYQSHCVEQADCDTIAPWDETQRVPPGLQLVDIQPGFLAASAIVSLMVPSRRKMSASWPELPATFSANRFEKLTMDGVNQKCSCGTVR